MADKIYPLFVQEALKGSANINLLSGNVKAILIDLADYTYSDAHQFLSDVPAAARVAISAALANPTMVNKVFDADNVTWSAVSGDVSEAFILFYDTGVEGTSRLIYFNDTATSLPVTPNGGDINLNFNASGIFRLGTA